MLRFKTVTVLCFFSLFMMIFTSCNNKSQFKVGFLMPNMVSDRYLKEKVYFSTKITEAGGEALVLSADYDAQKQLVQANELLNQGVKVLIVNPINLNTAAKIVRDAHEKNVPVIAYDRLIKNCDLDFFLSFDNVQVGKLMAEYCTKIKPSGNYVLLGGDKGDQNAVWVKKGQLEGLNQFINSGKIKIVFDVYVEDWSGENARIEMNKFLDLSGIIPDAILSSYDGMSTGVITYLDRKYHLKPGEILMTGQDAELAACRNIVNGYQTMTIYKSVKNLAHKAAEVAIKLAHEEKITLTNSVINNGYKDVPAILLEPTVVDANNLKSTVIADGFLTESEIYK